MVGKTLTFAVVVLVAAMTMTACDESSPVAAPEGAGGNPSTRLAGLGDCQQLLLAGDGDEEQLVVSVTEGTVCFTHQGAAFNCCIDSVTLSVALDGTEIVVTETDHCSNPCHCTCPRDVHGEILDLAAGTYSITVCDTSGAVQCTADNICVN